MPRHLSMLMPLLTEHLLLMLQVLQVGTLTVNTGRWRRTRRELKWGPTSRTWPTAMNAGTYIVIRINSVNPYCHLTAFVCLWICVLIRSRDKVICSTAQVQGTHILQKLKARSIRVELRLARQPNIPITQVATGQTSSGLLWSFSRMTILRSSGW